MLILNLAVADLLMGFYLIILGVAGAVFDGDFCIHELTWRSGITCQVMGALVVISSETSVITMVLLASVKIFAVAKVNIRFRNVVVSLFTKLPWRGSNEEVRVKLPPVHHIRWRFIMPNAKTKTLAKSIFKFSGLTRLEIER